MSLQREQTNWLRLLAKRPIVKQLEIVKCCNLTFIKDLHKLIKHIAYDKNLKISPKYKVFLKKHKLFLHNFLKERSHKKKRVNLLRKVKGGFLGLLIPSLISLASSIIAK